MELTKHDDGSYIIPKDYTGNTTLLKAGYPKDSKFILEKDIKKEDSPPLEKPADEPAKSDNPLLNNQDEPIAKKEDGTETTIFDLPEIKAMGITDNAKLVEHLAMMKGMGETIETLRVKAEANPFAKLEVDEDTIKEVLLSKESPDMYKSYMKLKHGNISDMDVLIMRKMKDDPEIFTSEDIARSYIEDEYELLTPIEIPADAEEDEIESIRAQNVKIQKKNNIIETRIKIEAKKAKEELQGAVNKYQIPKAKTEDEVKKEQDDFVKKWKPDFEGKIIADKEIELTGGMKFELNEKALSLYRTMAANYIMQQGVEPTPEEIEKVRKYAAKVVMAEFSDEIFMAVSKNVRKMADDEYDSYVAKKYFNSSSVHKEDHKNPETKSSGAADYIADLKQRVK